MARVKHTKNELKAQRAALSRFQRFLPMLLLKKQQLQMEIHSIDGKLSLNVQAEKSRMDDLDRWIGLFATTDTVPDLAVLDMVRTSEGNVAGITVPLLAEVMVRKPDLDLFATPAWFDDAQDMLDALLRLRAERRILDEQRRLIIDELLTTSQRVNLFEKVKIPECRENIRVIRIFLGDQQTAAVVRGKIAKRRTTVAEYEEETVWTPVPETGEGAP